MATTISAKYQAGRNHLETANDEREIALSIRRNGNYANFVVTVEGRSFQVGSYFAPRKSLSMDHRDYEPLAPHFRALLTAPAAAPKPAAVAAPAATSPAPVAPKPAPAPAPAVPQVIRDWEDLKAAAARGGYNDQVRLEKFERRNNLSSRDCGCPGTCRDCGTRCYGDCHVR